MEQNSKLPRWEGKVTTKLKNVTKNQTWPLIKDFFNLHKYFPNLTTCHGIHGVNSQPGCMRYCAGFSLPSAESCSETTVSWSKERLVAVDEVEFSIKYEIVDCNIGFECYESTMKVVDEGDDGGCLIEWWFGVDAVDGLVFGDLVSKYRVGVEFMGQKMEEEIVASLLSS